MKEGHALLTDMILSSAISMLAIIVIIAYYRQLFRTFFAKDNWYGNPFYIRITSLAIVAPVFKSILFQFVLAPLLFAIKLGAYLAGVLREYLSGITISPGQDHVNELLSQLNDFFSSLDIFKMILAVAIVALLNLAAKKSFHDERSGKYDASNMPEYYKHLVVLLFFIGSSLYIIFTALVALPYLDKNKYVSDISPNTFDSLYQNTALPDNITEIKSLSGDSLLAPYKRDLKDLSGQDVVQGCPSLSDAITHSLSFMDYLDKTRNDFIRMYADYIKAYSEKKQEALNNIKADLATAKASINGYLLESYFNSLQSWYSATINRNADFRKYISGRYKDYEQAVETYGRTALSDIRTRSRDTFFLKSGGSYTPNYGDNELISMYNDLVSQLQMQNYGFYSRPLPPSPGKDWGIIGDASAWLLKPNSVDVVLIIGMFGFGIFGAAISSFIRNKLFIAGSDVNISVRENVILILIRGLSAAIIVFLTTKGGIALVNNGSNDPNAYILFFSCLVGAVFSEEIWDWAKKLLLKDQYPKTSLSQTDKATDQK